MNVPAFRLRPLHPTSFRAWRRKGIASDYLRCIDAALERMDSLQAPVNRAWLRLCTTPHVPLPASLALGPALLLPKAGKVPGSSNAQSAGQETSNDLMHQGNPLDGLVR